MVELTTKESVVVLTSVNPATQKTLTGSFPVATSAEIETAVKLAHEAWKFYKHTTGKEKAIFLRCIANEIEILGNSLVQRAIAESGLPEGRIKGEIGRTCNQLRLFSDLVEEGSWVNAVLDEALPNRQPMSRVDIRKMSISIGVVAVFTASNFPLAFSTAGGDTASALAAGCPVIVKGHPSHLGTNELVTKAITRAVKKCNLPKGVFSSLTGEIETGRQLVWHPLVKAVGFTGSFKGGKALYDLANSRPEPIPVYAEMGSTNPIFILQEKLKLDYAALAVTIADSVNLSAGQFCTNPGIIVLQKSEATSAFLENLKAAFSKFKSATMLNEGIYKAYNYGKKNCLTTTGVSVLYENKKGDAQWKAEPTVASVSASQYSENKNLQEEVFGPFTIVVICECEQEVLSVANNLPGQLTATVMSTNEELLDASDLIELLTQKAGRVIFNNVPTGVEVCYAMHHGGPYPSTSNSQYTSVGTDAIQRFVRPITFQNMPNILLPEALKQANPLNIWRTVNGKKMKA